MELEKIRELRNAQPFRPFSLILDDRRRFTVGHPAYLGISPKQDLLLASSDTGTAWFSSNQIKDINVIQRAKAG